uniref:U1 small nuclear ribonucleoprotein 70 kDa n=1 Tax=Sinocyclocheilus rhinocerous TaxID=307959 RepID=A0A673IAV0_9TELE
MTQFLPPNLLALFAPRDPIPFLTQLEKLPHEKHHNQPYCGIAPFIRHFEDPRDAPPPTRAEMREERLERKVRDPHNDPNAQGDAFKTLFVARINYDTTESKLRREFEVYGPIKRIYIVYNKKTGKPRGYAFIEYEHERDMHSAYKHADGKKIDGRRVLVDVERGRTVKGWHPRRLGVLVVQGEEGQMSTSSTLAETTLPAMMTDQLEVTAIVNAGIAVGTESGTVVSAAVHDLERDADAPGLVSARRPSWFQGRRQEVAVGAETGNETEVLLKAAERGVETKIEKETARGEAGAGIERETEREGKVWMEERKAWAG